MSTTMRRVIHYLESQDPSSGYRSSLTLGLTFGEAFVRSLVEQ